MMYFAPVLSAGRRAVFGPGFLLAAVLCLAVACSPRLSTRYASAEDVSLRSASLSAGGGPNSNPCLASASYVPDTNHLAFTPVRRIRINFHFMDNQAGTRNKGEAEGRKFARDLIYHAQKRLNANKKMWLPRGNSVPALPVRLAYVLTGRPDDPDDDGIYFHRDDELFYYIHKGKGRNLFSREVIDTYGVQLDSVLNIFILPSYPDSLRPETTSRGGGVGIFLQNAIKLAGPPESTAAAWEFAGLFNHEMGHMLGLSHSWSGNDGCSDTPNHPNCWNVTDKSPCDQQASNNVMDYNAHQNAWTPCQIGRIHQSISRLGGRARRFVRPDWCQRDADDPLVVSDTVTWSGEKDLGRDLVIAPTGYLTIRCRVSIPAGGRVLVKAGGTLELEGARLHNACGDQWQGIQIEEAGGRRGVILSSEPPRIEDVLNPIEGLAAPGG